MARAPPAGAPGLPAGAPGLPSALPSALPSTAESEVEIWLPPGAPSRATAAGAARDPWDSSDGGGCRSGYLAFPGVSSEGELAFGAAGLSERLYGGGRDLTLHEAKEKCVGEAAEGGDGAAAPRLIRCSLPLTLGEHAEVCLALAATRDSAALQQWAAGLVDGRCPFVLYAFEYEWASCSLLQRLAEAEDAELGLRPGTAFARRVAEKPAAPVPERPARPKGLFPFPRAAAAAVERHWADLEAVFGGDGSPGGDGTVAAGGAAPGRGVAGGAGGVGGAFGDGRVRTSGAGGSASASGASFAAVPLHDAYPRLDKHLTRNLLQCLKPTEEPRDAAATAALTRGDSPASKPSGGAGAGGAGGGASASAGAAASAVPAAGGGADSSRKNFWVAGALRARAGGGAGEARGAEARDAGGAAMRPSPPPAQPSPPVPPRAKRRRLRPPLPATNELNADVINSWMGLLQARNERSRRAGAAVPCVLALPTDYVTVLCTAKEGSGGGDAVREAFSAGKPLSIGSAVAAAGEGGFIERAARAAPPATSSPALKDGGLSAAASSESGRPGRGLGARCNASARARNSAAESGEREVEPLSAVATEEFGVAASVEKSCQPLQKAKLSKVAKQLPAAEPAKAAAPSSAEKAPQAPPAEETPLAEKAPRAVSAPPRAPLPAAAPPPAWRPAFLAGAGVSRLSRFLAKRSINLFDYDRVLLPVHCLSAHWTLLEIDVAGRRLRYYDPLRNSFLHAADLRFARLGGRGLFWPTHNILGGRLQQNTVAGGGGAGGGGGHFGGEPARRGAAAAGSAEGPVPSLPPASQSCREAASAAAAPSTGGVVRRGSSELRARPRRRGSGQGTVGACPCAPAAEHASAAKAAVFAGVGRATRWAAPKCGARAARVGEAAAAATAPATAPAAQTAAAAATAALASSAGAPGAAATLLELHRQEGWILFEYIDAFLLDQARQRGLEGTLGLPWRRVVVAGWTQQDEASFDCGVVVCHYARCIAEGLSRPDFSSHDTALLRLFSTACLLHGEILLPMPPTPSPARILPTAEPLPQAAETPQLQPLPDSLVPPGQQSPPQPAALLPPKTERRGQSRGRGVRGGFCTVS